MRKVEIYLTIKFTLGSPTAFPITVIVVLPITSRTYIVMESIAFMFPKSTGSFNTDLAFVATARTRRSVAQQLHYYNRHS